MSESRTLEQNVVKPYTQTTQFVMENEISEDTACTEEVPKCILCSESCISNQVNLGTKGLDSLIKFSVHRKDSTLNDVLTKCKTSADTTNYVVHESCRKEYTNKRCMHISFRSGEDKENDITPCEAKKPRLALRSHKQPFRWKKDCFLCGEKIHVDLKHPDRTIFSASSKVTFRDKILEVCHQRNDAWSLEVCCRLQTCDDIVAAGAVYHTSCYDAFRLGGRKDRKSKRQSSGRPENSPKCEAFALLCDWLEDNTEDNMFTISELQAQMRNLSTSSIDSDPYSVRWLTSKLDQHFGDHVFFAKKNGKETIVCLRDMAGFLIRRLYRARLEESDDKRIQLVKTAAKIIKRDITEMAYSTDSYPSSQEISDLTNGKKFLPLSLQVFVEYLMSSELKQVSIGQCLVGAVRSSVILPIPFGLGVETDHLFGSRWLVSELHRLGFSISYDEVGRYKQSVLQTEDAENTIGQHFPGAFTQWVADNVDHNIATLNGQGTFHGMGIISVTTPPRNTEFSTIRTSKHVPRMQRMTAKDLVKTKGIPIVPYYSSNSPSVIVLKPLIQLQSPYILPTSSATDLIWQMSWFFKQKKRPSWSGFMQDVTTSQDHPPKADIHFLPIIDLESTNATCIYSTLLYIENQAASLNIPTPCITFDQPLWIKAIDIIQRKKMNVVCRLGGFHMLMSFLGSIGSVMTGSGLSELLQCSYGSNAVSHMLSGNAVARAVRGHLLASSALFITLFDTSRYVRTEEDHSTQNINRSHENNDQRYPGTHKEIATAESRESNRADTSIMATTRRNDKHEQTLSREEVALVEELGRTRTGEAVLVTTENVTANREQGSNIDFRNTAEVESMTYASKRSDTMSKEAVIKANDPLAEVVSDEVIVHELSGQIEDVKVDETERYIGSGKTEANRGECIAIRAQQTSVVETEVKASMGYSNNHTGRTRRNGGKEDRENDIGESVQTIGEDILREKLRETLMTEEQIQMKAERATAEGSTKNVDGMHNNETVRTQIETPSDNEEVSRQIGSEITLVDGSEEAHVQEDKTAESLMRRMRVEKMISKRLEQATREDAKEIKESEQSKSIDKLGTQASGSQVRTNEGVITSDLGSTRTTEVEEINPAVEQGQTRTMEEERTTTLSRQGIQEDILVETAAQPNRSDELTTTVSAHARDGTCGDLGTLSEEDITELCDLYDGLLENKVCESDMSNSLVLQKLEEIMMAYKNRLAKISRTSKLWLQYMRYIDIVKQFIRAERMGNWHLHLITVGQMLNLFAAVGHNNYAKCSRLYLQMMTELPTTHPWLADQFQLHGYHTIRRSDRFWAGLWPDLVIEQVLMRTIKTRGGLTRGRGMTENVRTTWTNSMHRCAEVHRAMTSTTKLDYVPNDQHVEMRKARIKQDNEDLDKMLVWLKAHNPFGQRKGLVSLATGGVAPDDDRRQINCDEAEEVGKKIQQQMDNTNITELVMRRGAQVRTLVELQKGLQIGNQVIHIDASLLFSRLTILIERSNDMASYFTYELSPYPPSLFSNGYMRKADKASLAKAVLQTPTSTSILIAPGMQYVLDGGALLHRVRWQRNMSYDEICQQYLSFIKDRYGSGCTVVFDGYDNGPSTKDHEHNRRSRRVLSAVNTIFDSTMIVDTSQQAFLSNGRNKSLFIKLLAEHLVSDGHVVHQSLHDADTEIVSTALDIAATGIEVTVVADDTDIVILLLHHYKSALPKMFLRSEAKCKIYDIQAEQQQLGEDICKRLLFIHAWGGCDTVSALYGKGKVSILKRMKSCALTREVCDVLCDENMSQNEVATASFKLLVAVYGGKDSDNLNKLRYLKYMSSIARCTTKPKPEMLPPTERAAFFHCLRIHLQIVQWKTLMSSEIEPTEWGWKLDGNQLVPVQTDLQAAPEDILSVIRCKCKSSTRNQCGNTACSCRKHGLNCVSACGECHGIDCSNKAKATCSDDIDV